jgi:hypothetical protein
MVELQAVFSSDQIAESPSNPLLAAEKENYREFYAETKRVRALLPSVRFSLVVILVVCSDRFHGSRWQ